MRRTSLETPPTWAFSALEAADATQVVGEVVREAAGGGAAGFVAAKTGLISAGGGRVSVDKGGSSTAAWGLSSFQGGMKPRLRCAVWQRSWMNPSNGSLRG